MTLPPTSFSGKWWRTSLWIALAVSAFFVLYVLILDQGFTLASLAKVMAGTSNILLAMSFSLSGLGYYFNFLDSKVMYRKYLGLLGYFAALAYCFLLMVVRPERYFFGFFENFWSTDIILGLSAMAILTGMALISNDKAMLWIGPQRWRACLRFGYLAYFLLVLRAIINQNNPIGADPFGEMWAQYLRDPHNLPPVRLLFSVVALSVIFFRLSVTFDKWRRKPTLETQSIKDEPKKATWDQVA